MLSFLQEYQIQVRKEDMQFHGGCDNEINNKIMQQGSCTSITMEWHRDIRNLEYIKGLQKKVKKNQQ